MVPCVFFFAYFYPKTWWTIQKSLFFQKFRFEFMRKKFFFAVFGWHFTPWIRTRIQEAKILRIRWSQNLSLIFKTEMTLFARIQSEGYHCMSGSLKIVLQLGPYLIYPTLFLWGNGRGGGGGILGSSSSRKFA